VTQPMDFELRVSFIFTRTMVDEVQTQWERIRLWLRAICCRIKR
jgi:hypothetical protein